jgi:Family of unknown function (DUF6455)
MWAREVAMFNFDRIDRQMKNFHGMVERLGVDPVDLATDCLGYRLTSALRRCAVCDASAECRAWITQAAAGTANAPTFCPNADIFARARRLPHARG